MTLTSWTVSTVTSEHHATVLDSQGYYDVGERKHKARRAAGKLCCSARTRLHAVEFQGLARMPASILGCVRAFARADTGTLACKNDRKYMPSVRCGGAGGRDSWGSVCPAVTCPRLPSGADVAGRHPIEPKEASGRLQQTIPGPKVSSLKQSGCPASQRRSSHRGRTLRSAGRQPSPDCCVPRCCGARASRLAGCAAGRRAAPWARRDGRQHAISIAPHRKAAQDIAAKTFCN